jgi:acyl-CoA thioesterase I
MLEQAVHRGGYVGSRKTNGGLSHEAYSGKNVEFLAKTVPAQFVEPPADIVLMHAGHNHLADEHPVPGIVAATEAMIADFRKGNPRVVVLVARVIPGGKLPKYSYIPKLNGELAPMARPLDRPGQRVLSVDQAHGFDVETDTIADKVHPNAVGARKMAARWFEAIEPLLGSPPSATVGNDATVGDGEACRGRKTPHAPRRTPALSIRVHASATDLSRSMPRQPDSTTVTS